MGDVNKRGARMRELAAVVEVSRWRAEVVWVAELGKESLEVGKNRTGGR